MAEWLCELVGPQGRVVATDVETKFLEAIDAGNLEVRKHDIAADPLEVDSFDLIHIRAVLAHLPRRERVVRRLVSALRPGGWLVPIVADLSSSGPLQANEEDADFFDRTFASVVEASHGTPSPPCIG